MFSFITPKSLRKKQLKVICKQNRYSVKHAFFNECDEYVVFRIIFLFKCTVIFLHVVFPLFNEHQRKTIAKAKGYKTNVATIDEDETFGL